MALVFLGLLLLSMNLLLDWMIYKNRGKARPDDPKDPNPPVITGPQDASAQHLLDLSKKDFSKKK